MTGVTAGNCLNCHNRCWDPHVSHPGEAGGLLGRPRFSRTLAAPNQPGLTCGRLGSLADDSYRGKKDISHGSNRHTDSIKGGAHFTS